MCSGYEAMQRRYIHLLVIVTGKKNTILTMFSNQPLFQLRSNLAFKMVPSLLQNVSCMFQSIISSFSCPSMLGQSQGVGDIVGEADPSGGVGHKFTLSVTDSFIHVPVSDSAILIYVVYHPCARMLHKHARNHRLADHWLRLHT